MVDSEPIAAGIDPRNLLIDTEGGDNVAELPRDRAAGAVRR
jgi:hypothetical protein